ncbi:alpha-amylase family glycosyl hydrolase [Deinococcus arenicola]|uniref:Alpha-amylase n=1 Tax=Deinococcus arenicola TaxID=2994950 RepID=A0ABU4DMP1_9DEIO|nr:alpha-amylase family glycosyl hydrolase [Deinococcus sp. ZS9-10]MDV6373706.1 alpha-amylase family glycosyl hydrolase [Deinococcus sp. ZS9-10]
MQNILSLGVLLALAGASAQGNAPLTSYEGQVMYQVMPDRFFDGNTANNADVNRDDPRAWHGGDLKGLTQKLPYIKKLGATAVWLTPVYQQQTQNFSDTAPYHGYWPANFRRVDPHFGTLADFGTFVKATQAGGMRVVLDQVINHYGYGAPAVKEHPAWFNTQARCDASREKDIDCPLAGLPDLKQDNLEVRELLLGNARFWRDQGVQGFRYDAIKNVDPLFLGDLLSSDRAAGVWTLGEWYNADSGTVAGWQRRGFDSLFLFSLQAAMKGSIMAGQGLDSVAAVLSRQGELPRPGEVALFLDNHDVPRFAQGSLFEDVGQARTRYGLRALMTLRGVPVIWQGTEIAMRGGTDPDNRRDMRFETQWTPQEKAVFDVTRGAIKVRRDSPALSKGTLTLLDTPARLKNDLLLFTRESGRHRVLVAWHGAKERRSYSVRLDGLGLKDGGKPMMASLFAGQNAKIKISGGYLHLSLPPEDASAFKLN